VVLPEPKKPVRTVVGINMACFLGMNAQRGAV